jgi:hypothetical protein
MRGQISPHLVRGVVNNKKRSPLLASGERFFFQRGKLDLEFAVFIKQFVVHTDFTVLFDIAYEIPMDAGFVLASCFRVSGAHSHVKGASDLFIVQDAFCKLLNAIVRANGEFSQIT